MIYRLERSGEVDLEFDGEMLAEESTRDYSRGARQVDRTRWTEVRIYRLLSGDGWVVEYVGKSARKGEIDRPRVTVCRRPQEVVDALRRREGEYLIDAAVDVLNESADKDARLRSASVERL